MTWAEISAVEALGEGRYRAAIDPVWTIAGRANGGYLLGMAARAAAHVSGRADVLSASAVYLHAPRSEGIEIVAEQLRSGRSVSHVRARLSQGATVCVEALFMTADLAAAGDLQWDRGVPTVEVAPFDECVRLPDAARDGTPLTIMGRNDVRLDPSTAGFLSGRPSGAGELRGWVALDGGEPFNTFSLLYAVDSFLPASSEIRPVGWAPTLELTAHIRARPAPGPLRVLQRAQLARSVQ